MAGVMKDLRENPPRELGGVAVGKILDIKNDRVTDYSTGGEDGKPSITKGPGLPSSNVLQFFLSDGSKVSARPSGTEPKIKFYASCHSAPGTPLDEARRQVAARIAAIDGDIRSIIEKAERGAGR